MSDTALLDAGAAITSAVKYFLMIESEAAAYNYLGKTEESISTAEVKALL